MPRVSYQAMLGDEEEGPRGGAFEVLDEEAIATRSKDAKRELTVKLSKEQVRWLREVEELAGQGIDASAVVRALVDLGPRARRRLDRPGPRPRAARGGPPVRARAPGADGRLMAKAWDVPGLRGDARFSDAAGRIILTRWRETMSYRDGTLAGEDIEELHAMRVASRRLRAAMDAFAAAFPPQVVPAVPAPGQGDHRRAGRGARPRRGHRGARWRARRHAAEVERPGLEGLIARYRTERAAETRGDRRAVPPAGRGRLRPPPRALGRAAHRRLGRAPGPRAAGGGLMAKPRPVEGLDPRRRLRPNARRILAVRIDEVWGYERVVQQPDAVTELHDMRIACKRLRYLLEIFSVAFSDDLEPYIDQVKELQDLLGDIHDRDVQVPALQEHLAWLERREAEAAQRLVARRSGARGQRRRRRRPRGGPARLPPQLRPGAPRRRAPRRARPHRHAARRAPGALRPLRRRVAADAPGALPGPAGGRPRPLLTSRPSASRSWATCTATCRRCAPCSTPFSAAGIARGVVTGDLVMRGAEPEACIALVRATGWPVVAGNTDRRVALESPRPRRHPASTRVGSRVLDPPPPVAAPTSTGSPTLPLVAHVELGPFRVAVVHGAVDDPSVAPRADTPDADLVALATALDADAVVTGHTHRPHVRRVAGLLFVNPGSVGEGVPEERRPAWAWLAAGPTRLEVALERVPEPLAALRV